MSLDWSLTALTGWQDYIAVKNHQVYTAHTAGRYAARRFHKAQVCLLFHARFPN
jgi:hypothetical protein